MTLFSLGFCLRWMQGLFLLESCCLRTWGFPGGPSLNLRCTWGVVCAGTTPWSATKGRPGGAPSLLPSLSLVLGWAALVFLSFAGQCWLRSHPSTVFVHMTYIPALCVSMCVYAWHVCPYLWRLLPYPCVCTCAHVCVCPPLAHTLCEAGPQARITSYTSSTWTRQAAAISPSLLCDQHVVWHRVSTW